MDEQKAQDPMVVALNHLWFQRQKLMESVKWLLTSGDDDSRATALALVKEIDESNGLRPEASPLFPSEDKAQELVRNLEDYAEFDWSKPKCTLDGRFTPDELEAMAWCMRNDKWPAR